MAQNKKALLRYQVYDACFKNRAALYDKKRLIEKVNERLADAGLEGISKSQFYSDIKYMMYGDWNAPIETFKKQGNIVYYRYSDPKFSISKIPLNDTDLKQIKEALAVFQNFSGLPQFEFMRDLLLALDEKITILSTKEFPKQSVIDYETNVDYIGNKYIKPLFNAIINKEVVKFEYAPFDPVGIAGIKIFHPMYLKQYNTRWFVFGYNEGNFQDVIIYALDRIASPEIESILDIKYYNNNYPWNEYLDDRLGVTKPFNEDYTKYDVEIWIDKLQSKYIISKPMHHSQKYYEENDGYKFKYKMVLNFELERFILGLGESAKVIAPQILKDKLKQRLLQSIRNYED